MSPKPCSPYSSPCSYPTRPGYRVLQDFSLTLPPCQTVAIVGPSGGGTSPPPASPWVHHPVPQSSARDWEPPRAAGARGAQGSPPQGSQRWQRCWSGSMSPRQEPSPWMGTTSPAWTPPGCGDRSLASSARWGQEWGWLRCPGCPWGRGGSALRAVVLLQEPVLFGTTIMENIRFGKPGASDAEVYEAARLANADGFIRSFPEGYNTIVGMAGVGQASVGPQLR